MVNDLKQGSMISFRKTTKEDLEHAEELGQELWEVRMASKEVVENYPRFKGPTATSLLCDRKYELFPCDQ